MPALKLNDVTLNYRLEGAGDRRLVVLSNSLASNLTMWDAQVPALLAGGFRVLRYDTRGHGASSVPPAPYTLDTLAGDVKSLLDALDIQQAHFCGLSLGGMTGQKFATLYGERLSSLVLCATAAYMGTPEVWDTRIKLVSEKGMEAVVDATLARWFTAKNQQRLPHEVAQIRAGILATPPTGYCGCGGAIRDMDQREAIRGIRTPTLVMVGALDPATTVDAARVMHERIPGAELLIIPESQHLFNVEFPAQFNAGLVNFLQRHR